MVAPNKGIGCAGLSQQLSSKHHRDPVDWGGAAMCQSSGNILLYWPSALLHLPQKVGTAQGSAWAGTYGGRFDVSLCFVGTKHNELCWPMPYKHTWCQSVTSLHALLEAILCIYCQLKATVWDYFSWKILKTRCGSVFSFCSHPIVCWSPFLFHNLFFHSTRNMIYFSF